MSEQDIFRLCISGGGALLFFIWVYYNSRDIWLSIIITAFLFMISLGMWV